MRDFYEPVYSYQTSNNIKFQTDHSKKSSNSSSSHNGGSGGGGGGSSSGSSGNVLGRFLKLGKSKSDAHGHGLKSRTSRPSSYHSDDFEEDFRLTPSSKSPVERMVHKVNSRKDVSRSHSWIYGSVKLPSEFNGGYGESSSGSNGNGGYSPGGGGGQFSNYPASASASGQSSMHHGIPRCQKMDYCGTCDCTNDFDFMTGPHNHHHHGNNNFSSTSAANNATAASMMSLEGGGGGCPGCNPAYAAVSECGKGARQQYFAGLYGTGMGGGKSRQKQQGSSSSSSSQIGGGGSGSGGILDSGKKFGSSVRKLTWKSLKQAVRKRPSLDVLKKSSSNSQQFQPLPPPPSSSAAMMMYHHNGTMQNIPPPGCSHDDLLGGGGTNYFFPEKKSFYASCTDLYGESPPYVASVRVRPKRSRQPWPLNEFGPVPNYQEEEIYHSEWDLRQFMPYDVWLTAANGNSNAPLPPPLNNSIGQNGSNALVGTGTGNRIPKVNRSSNALTASPSSCSSSSAAAANSNNNNVIKNKAAMGSSSTIYGYGQTIVKRSSILRTDVTAYQLIKSTTAGGGASSSSTMSDGTNGGGHHNGGEQSDSSDDLSDNVLTEDPVRIGGQGIYMISSNPAITNNNNNNSSSSAASSLSNNNNSCGTMSNLQTTMYDQPNSNNRTSTFTGGLSNKNKNNTMDGTTLSSSLSGEKVRINESTLRQQASLLSSSSKLSDMRQAGGSSLSGIRDRDQPQQQQHSDNNRLMDLHDQPPSTSSTFSPINNGNSLKTYCSQPQTTINNSNGPAGTAKLNTAKLIMLSERCGTKFNDNDNPHVSSLSSTNENNQDYLRHFETYEYRDDIDDSSSNYQSKNHNSDQSDNKYFPNNNNNNHSENNNNSTNSSTDSNNKYGALKRRKSRTGPGSSSTTSSSASSSKTLLKETIYEEDSDEGGGTESRRNHNSNHNQDIYAVKIVVSQNVTTSEYVKPILKKERVYETPSCMDGKNYKVSSSSFSSSSSLSSTFNNNDTNSYYSGGGGSDVCNNGGSGSGTGTRSTKKVQFDNSKLVVCRGLSEDDEDDDDDDDGGDESDDTLVKTDNTSNSDWIVDEESSPSTRQPSSSSSRGGRAENENKFLMENDSINSGTNSRFLTETKNNFSTHHHQQQHGGGGVNNPSSSSSSQSASKAKQHVDNGSFRPGDGPKKLYEQKTKTKGNSGGGGGDQMNQSHVDNYGGNGKLVEVENNRDKIKVQPRKFSSETTTTPHAPSSSSSLKKADRIVNMPERKTVKGPGQEQIINPNSLLFHDTTRIRLNQTRPSIEHTFKLNLGQQSGGSNGSAGGGQSSSSRLENGGVSRGSRIIKQSSSFRTPVVAGSLVNSKFQMRPREPPPPPPPSASSSSSSSNSNSWKMQKTLSNIAKIEKRPNNNGESQQQQQHQQSKEGQCSSRGNNNKASTAAAGEISLALTGGAKNGINMRNIDGSWKGATAAAGTHNSTNNNSNNSKHSNKNAHGKTSNTVPNTLNTVGSATTTTTTTKNCVMTTTSTTNNTTNQRQVKVSSNRSKSLAERCKAVEKVLAQHSPSSSSSTSSSSPSSLHPNQPTMATTSPQTHEEKQTKTNNLIKTTTINGGGGGNNKVCENNKISPNTTTNILKKNGTTFPNSNCGVGDDDDDETGMRCDEEKISNKNIGLHQEQEQNFDKNESYGQNNNNYQIESTKMPKDSHYSSSDGTQNIEIVTKENSVSEIRIYSGTTNLNIDRSTEAAQILNNYGRPKAATSSSTSPSTNNSNGNCDEIHYASTDIVCPSSASGMRNNSSKPGDNNTCNNNGSHFRQTSAPSSVISSRPQSTSVVLIMDYSSAPSASTSNHHNQQDNQRGEEEDRSVVSGNSMIDENVEERLRSLNETKTTATTTTTVENNNDEKKKKKQSHRPLQLPSASPSLEANNISNTMTRIDEEEEARITSCLRQENGDSRLIDIAKKTCSSPPQPEQCEKEKEDEEEGGSGGSAAAVAAGKEKFVEEPLYDDVINHSTRQASMNDQRLAAKKHSTLLSPLFQSLSKELTDRTTNAMSNNSNKYPTLPARPSSLPYASSYERKNEENKQQQQLPPLPSSLPPLPALPPQNNNNNNKNNSNYPPPSSSSSLLNCGEDELLDNLYNDIEFNTISSLPPPLPPPPSSSCGGGLFGSISYNKRNHHHHHNHNHRMMGGGTELEDDRIIYDDTLSLISSNYSRSIINGKIHEGIEEEENNHLNGGGTMEEEPLYDDVLNVRTTGDSDSGAETEDSPPPPLPQGPPPIHLLQKPCTDLPLLSFPLLLTTTNNNNNNNISGGSMMRKNSDPVILPDKDLVQTGMTLDNTKSLTNESTSENNLKKRKGSNNNRLLDNGDGNNDDDDDVLDRTRTLLTELNDRLAKLNFQSPADYSTYVSKVIISSSSESSGVEEDYNSEKNYSLSNGSFDENYRLTAVSKLVSETISMARGKFLDSMKLNNSNNNNGVIASNNGSLVTGNGSRSSVVGSGSVSSRSNHHGGVNSPSSSSSSSLSSSSSGGAAELLEPIYEEIGDLLNRSTSPIYADAFDAQKDTFDAKSIFDGASKNEILSFLESIRDKLAAAESNSTDSAASSLNRSSKKIVEIERNDSGIGSESGSLVAVSNKSALATAAAAAAAAAAASAGGLRLCTDCSDAPVDPRLNTPTTTVNGESSPNGSGSGQVGTSCRASTLCRCCIRKRSERKELLQEIYETELKYGRDLRIIEEEFYNPIQIAGLLTKEQLDQIFLNVGDLVEVNQQLTSMFKSAIDTATAIQDEDLMSVNVGKIFMEFGETMMTTFDAYCTRQASAGALLTQLEKEKELLRIFLRVSQMENSTLRRMNLPAFLMVPVQRVTRYPLLLARLLKVTPVDHFSREELYSAQEKIEQHLEHMNKTTREVASVKLWRRISIMNGNSSPVHRRSNSDLDGANVRIRKMALDVLDWANFSDVSCVIESQLNVVHFNGKTLRNIYGCLLARGKDLESLALKMERNDLFFPPAEDIVKDVKLVLVRVKNTRFCLLREPFCLSKAVISQGENEFQDFIEINEIITKNTYYFQGMEKHGTMEWLRLLQCHAVCVGQWRRRRGALANIMMNGMIRHL